MVPAQDRSQISLLPQPLIRSSQPPSLRIARRVDHTQRGGVDGLHSGEFEDAEFKPAYGGAQLRQLVGLSGDVQRLAWFDQLWVARLNLVRITADDLFICVVDLPPQGFGRTTVIMNGDC